jgi:hypothetical protein
MTYESFFSEQNDFREFVSCNSNINGLCCTWQIYKRVLSPCYMGITVILYLCPIHRLIQRHKAVRISLLFLPLPLFDIMALEVYLCTVQRDY